MKKKCIYFFIGTTAEFIKLAPVIKDLKKRKIDFKIITSGQNNIRFDNLSKFVGTIKPDIAFKEKKNKSSTFHFIFWAIKIFFICLWRLRQEFRKIDKNNIYFIIHGDTVTSTIGAIISTIYHIKLIHIESGYLSFNFLEPFPEEICRNINIRLADILFCPTDWTTNNLKRFHKITINTKQNTMIETFWWAMKQKVISPKVINRDKYYILIMHRQEHVVFRKNWSRNILETVIKYSKDDLDCILINYPITVEIIKSLKLEEKKMKIKVIPQISYIEFIKLMNNAEYIVSDGATNQQEAYYLGKPLLALRDYTEQTEGMGENVVLCKSNKEVIREFLQNYKNYRRQPVKYNKKPSKIITDFIINH